MSALASIAIQDIVRRSDVRPLVDETVAGLAESIAAVGLINPIRVRRKGEGFEVVAGSHRLAACDSLDWREIPAIVVDDDDLHAELAMIDENLCRAELSAVDRAKQTARRKSIYEALHPETTREATLKKGEKLPSRQRGETGKSERFTGNTAAATGQSERAIQRDAERGTKVSDAAAAVIRGTKLDSGAYLDKLKRLPAAKQVETAKRDLAAPSAKGGIAGRYAPTAPRELTADQRLTRYLKLMDEVEALDVPALVKGAGRKRAVVGQRAASAIQKLNSITEALA